MKYINLQIQESKWATNRINSKVINKLWKQKTKKFLKEVRENWYIMHVCVAQSHPILCDPMDCSPPGSSVHEDSPCKNTGVGWHALFQSVFPTQGMNPGLRHCRQILYHLSHQGSPRILVCVAYPFSGGSSWLRNWTRVSCIAGRFFTSWVSREAPTSCIGKP